VWLIPHPAHRVHSRARCPRSHAPAVALIRGKWNAARFLGQEMPIPSGPVLLVDDMVDSGWTLTLLGVLLRLRGSGPVHPFALAKASPRGS